MIRVLGKGITAQAIQERFDEVTLYDETDFHTYDVNSNEITVVSPGIPPYHSMVKQSKNIMSDYDLFASIMPKSIWISGTNGKTTTTQMIQHLLASRGSVCGGNIGIPLSSMDENASLWILETSSFTMHYTKEAKPNLYILLPISEDHISWHGSFEEYKEAKLKPLTMMEEGSIVILPEEFKAYPTHACKITYKNSDDICEALGLNKNKVEFKEPFLLDALLALSCQKILFDEINYDLINTFKVDKHKVEEFTDKNSRVWVDDSKATNIDATLNALVPYKEKKIYLILGGDDKGAKLEPLFDVLQSYDIEVFTIGSNTERLNELAKQYNITYTSCKELEKAVYEMSLKHDLKSVAMLSPAAASLDQFSSYKERGEQFKKFVSYLSLN